MKITKKKVEEKLLQVMDPELNISIIDLGLIYFIKIGRNNKVTITMTLTSMGCPLVSIIEQEIINKLKETGIKENNISIKLTFDPPWSIERMSKRGKALLGI